MIKLESFERSPKMSEIKAVYRSRTRTKERKQIHGAENAVEYLREIWNKDTLELTEDFVMVCLNTAHRDSAHKCAAWAVWRDGPWHDIFDSAFDRLAAHRRAEADSNRSKDAFP